MTMSSTVSDFHSSSALSPTIVLIEDDEDLAAMMVESLAFRGHGVIVTKNARDAELRLVDDAMSVLVTDFSVPGADGLSIIRRVRANPRFAHVAIVLATGHPDARRLEEAVRRLDAAFVQKPFGIDALLEAVAHARTLLPPLTLRLAV